MTEPAMRLLTPVLATFVIGCTATPTVQHLSPINADLSKYSALQVTVDAGNSALGGSPGYGITASELRGEFMANVRASGKYASVGTEAPGAKGLEARLTITGFRYVSGAARGTTGIIAGRAVLNVTMTLKDTETGEVLGVIAAGHRSHMGQGVFSPVTSEQITAIATELSSQLTKR